MVRLPLRCRPAISGIGYVASRRAAADRIFLGTGAAAEQLLRISIAWWLAALVWTFFFPTPIPTACAGWRIARAGAAVCRAGALYRRRAGVLVFALLIVWVADMGAYFAGKQFGRVKLAPAISPGKTWEGVIGGIVPWRCWRSLSRAHGPIAHGPWFVPFCLAVAALSIVGDLTVSMFKRTAGVKDSGTLFPGHGGVLDPHRQRRGRDAVVRAGLDLAGAVR